MSRIHAIACLLASWPAATCLGQQSEPPGWWTTQVTLKQDRVDIRDAIRAFFKQLNVNYSIAPEVQGTISCSLAGNAVEVLPRILSAVHSHYRTESGVVEIIYDEGKPYIPSKPSPMHRPPFRVTVSVPGKFHKAIVNGPLKFENASIQDALAALFTRVPERYILRAPTSAKVNGNFQKQPLDDVLRNLCSQANLDVSYANDTFEFRNAAGFLPPGMALGGGPDDMAFGLRVPPAGDWVVAEEPSKHP